ncbi:MAG: hypothetical protein N2Z21_00010 [Candidatus Sumerlaeaceae bacterium]|nr:hypothetical protein [Candidatus Sumerlaeaceae bacterium]
MSAHALNFLYLLFLGLRERWARSVLIISAVSVATLVNILTFVHGFGVIRQSVRHAEQLFPRGLLTVRPKALDFMAFKFNATVLDDRAVETIARLNGVEFVAPQVSLKMPLRAEGDIMGQSAVSDVVVVGIDPKLVEADVEPGYRFAYDDATSQPIPCIVPRFFLDMYNLAYADSLGLPKISERYPIGKTFSLVVGETYLLGGASGKSARFECRIVGLTRQTALMVGVLIPLEHAKALNRWYHGRAANEYNLLHVKLGDLNKHDDVTSAIRSLGFQTESKDEALENFLFVVSMTRLALGGFGVLIALVAMVAVFNTSSLSLMVRREELYVLYAVGGTPRYLRSLLLWEAFLTGALGGLIAGCVAQAIVEAVNSRLAIILAEISTVQVSLPTSFAGTLFLSIGLGAGYAVLCSIPFALNLRLTEQSL